MHFRRNVYGNNEIVIPVKNIFTLLCLEVLNPFYVFQLFSFCLWIADDYYYYAMAIFIMSSAGILMAVFQTRRVSHSPHPLNFHSSLVFAFVPRYVLKSPRLNVLFLTSSESTQSALDSALIRRCHGHARSHDRPNGDDTHRTLGTWRHPGDPVSRMSDAMRCGSADRQLHSQ
jgi:hypothetical protein